MKPLLARLRLDPRDAKVAMVQLNTPNEEPLRREILRGKGRNFGRPGWPTAWVDQLRRDYARLGSCALVARLYNRTPQTIWETLAHYFPLKPGSVARRAADCVVHDGVNYTPGKNGDLRATTGKRHPLKRVIWEQHHGPLPAGWNIVFVNGNKRDFAPENLHAGPAREITLRHLVRRFPTAGLPPDQQRERIRRRNLDYYHRRAQAHRERGLTCQGRKYKRPPLTPEQRAERARQRNLDGYHKRAARNAQRGLTSRGGAPVYRPRRKLTPTEAAYAALRAEIEAAPRELPIACGFRDTELNQRYAEAGRSQKKNFASYSFGRVAKLKESA